MIIERTNKEIIFRLPADTNVDELQDMADLLEYKEIAKKSKASQKDVDELVKTIKKGRWAATKSTLNL
ncbi:MAG TPA: hypothetical protein VIO15_12690 [Bacteroidales bacterium]